MNVTADARAGAGAFRSTPAVAHQIEQAGHLPRVLEQARRRPAVVELQRAAAIEPLDDRSDVGVLEVADEHVGDGRADQIAREVVGAAELAFVLQLELARDRRQRRVHVHHAGRPALRG